MLPKEIMGQGIPEESSDCTCIEKKVRGVRPFGGAAELPAAHVAVKAVAGEGCVGVRSLYLDYTCKLSHEAMITKASEMVARMINVAHSITAGRNVSSFPWLFRK